METVCIDCTKYEASDEVAKILAFLCQGVYLNFVAQLAVSVILGVNLTPTCHIYLVVTLKAPAHFPNVQAFQL